MSRAALQYRCKRPSQGHFISPSIVAMLDSKTKPRGRSSNAATKDVQFIRYGAASQSIGDFYGKLVRGFLHAAYRCRMSEAVA